MPERQRGAGTGLSVGMISAGAQLGTEPGADQEYADRFKAQPTATGKAGSNGGQGGGDTLRKKAKLSEEYTP